MNTRTLSILIIIALGVGLAALWTTFQTGPADTAEDLDAKMFPLLEEQVDQVTKVTLTKAGGETIATLRSENGSWAVDEKDGYPANRQELSKLLQQLADAQRVEEKTSNPELYSRLSVQDLDQPDAKGVLVEVTGLSAPLRLIVGKNNPQAGQTTYVRLVDDPQSWSIDREITPPMDTLGWLDRELLDIESGRIQRVVIHHPDGETLTVSKDSPEQENFTIEGIPADRKPSSEAIANSLGSVLSGLSLEDVRAAQQPESALEDDPVRVVYQTFDGLLIEATVAANRDDGLVQFSVRFDEQFRDSEAEPETNPAAEAAGESPAAEETEAIAEQDSKLQSPPDVEEMARSLEERLAQWVYRVPEYTLENMVKRMEDLLAPTEGSGNASTDVTEPPPAVIQLPPSSPVSGEASPTASE